MPCVFQIDPPQIDRWKPERIFLDSYCGNLFEFLEVNLGILWYPSHDWFPLDVFVLRVVHTEPLTTNE